MMASVSSYHLYMIYRHDADKWKLGRTQEFKQQQKVNASLYMNYDAI